MDPLSDRSNEGLPEDSLREAIRAALINTHTMLPGRIVQFYPEKQTADVQISLMRNYNGDIKPMAVLLDLPVRFPRAGGYAITFPVKEDDPCEVRFCERSLDEWFLNGGVVDPKDSRIHDFSDGVVDVGLHSLPEALEEFDTGAFNIRSIDGSQIIKMTDDGGVEVSVDTGDIKVGSASGNVELTAGSVSVNLKDDGTLELKNSIASFKLTPAGGFKVQGSTEELIALIDDLIVQIKAIIITGFGGLPVSPPSQAALEAIRVRLQTLKV